MWGYPLGLSKVRRPLASTLLWLGLAGSIVTHGLFDFFLFRENVYSLLAIPVFIGAGALFLFMLRHARRISPYKDKIGLMLTACPHCSQRVPLYAHFCPLCGQQLARGRQEPPAFCGKCGAAVPHQADFCTACGSRLIKQAES